MDYLVATPEQLEAVETIGVRFRFDGYEPGAYRLGAGNPDLLAITPVPRLDEFAVTWPRRPDPRFSAIVLEVREAFEAIPLLRHALARAYLRRLGLDVL